MKTFAEAVAIFTAGSTTRPAKSILEARRMARKTGRMLLKRYGYLDDEIKENELATQILWSYVVAFTERLEQGEPASNVLMNMAFSCFRHGLVIGIEMERIELQEEDDREDGEDGEDREEGTMRSVFGGNRPAPPPQDYPATSRQIKKLLTMLSIAELIDSWFEDRERQYDEEGAVEWLRSTMGIKVKTLEDLTNKQIGKCFEELGE